jgi:hypothetical protein
MLSNLGELHNRSEFRTLRTNSEHMGLCLFISYCVLRINGHTTLLEIFLKFMMNPRTESFLHNFICFLLFKIQSAHNHISFLYIQTNMTIDVHYTVSHAFFLWNLFIFA